MLQMHTFLEIIYIKSVCGCSSDLRKCLRFYTVNGPKEKPERTLKNNLKRKLGVGLFIGSMQFVIKQRSWALSKTHSQVAYAVRARRDGRGRSQHWPQGGSKVSTLEVPSFPVPEKHSQTVTEVHFLRVNLENKWI